MNQLYDKKSKIVIVFGTRPEFIKVLPILYLIKTRRIDGMFVTIFTNQHESIANELFKFFDYNPDYTLPCHKTNNSLVESFNYISREIGKVITKIQTKFKIKYIVGQGDTTSCACAAFISFLSNIPFAHIEAGLRTHCLTNPYPEEYFRKIISLSAAIHFAPTQLACQNLIAENVQKENIILTGNTIIDSIKLVKKLNKEVNEHLYLNIGRKNIIITCHRRENQAKVFDLLLIEIINLAKFHSEIDFIWFAHPNPVLRERLEKYCAHFNLNNLKIFPPCPYYIMVKIFKHIDLIISDSGGLQEEAAYFGIPIIIIRNTTERKESVDRNIASLINLDNEGLNKVFNFYLHNPIQAYPRLYGDGKATQRILDFLIK